jgi:serine/threonine protein phosphatase PrpC
MKPWRSKSDDGSEGGKRNSAQDRKKGQELEDKKRQMERDEQLGKGSKPPPGFAGPPASDPSAARIVYAPPAHNSAPAVPPVNVHRPPPAAPKQPAGRLRKGRADTPVKPARTAAHPASGSAGRGEQAGPSGGTKAPVADPVKPAAPRADPPASTPDLPARDIGKPAVEVHSPAIDAPELDVDRPPRSHEPTPVVKPRARATPAKTRAATPAATPLLPAPLTIGPAPAAFEPKLSPYTSPPRPDSIVDGGHAYGVTVRAASVRGRDKRADGKVRDDDFCIAPLPSRDAVVIAIADGMGSATRGWLGAVLACRHAVEEVGAQLKAAPVDELDWEKLFLRARLALREQYRKTAGRPETNLQEVSHDLGTTLVVAVIQRAGDGMDVSVAAVGDSPCWTLTGRVWKRIAGADDESDADGFATSDVSCLPYPIVPDGKSIHLESDQVLVLATDGFGKPLGDGTNDLGKTMSQYLRTPPALPVWSYVVDFGRRTYGDDRTIAAVWPDDPPK